jgi:purine-binding chemotaxis protein CheW
MEQNDLKSHAGNKIRASFADTINTSRFFTIFVDDKAFGLSVNEARIIFRVGDITPIPLTSKEITGLINLRGKVVVAVSLRYRLGDGFVSETQDSTRTKDSFAIGLEKGNEHFALLVDRVGDVLSLPESARLNIPPNFDTTLARFTRALYRVESNLIPILDVESLFNFGS